MVLLYKKDAAIHQYSRSDKGLGQHLRKNFTEFDLMLGVNIFGRASLWAEAAGESELQGGGGYRERIVFCVSMNMH